MQADGRALIKEEVDAEDIAEIVSKWTGIPVKKMLASDREKLLHLEQDLHHRVIGQDEAIRAVSDAVRRSRAGLQDPGYVGYDEGGQLTEAVRRHPYSVVLFDEIEKAHPDTFNILLQVLDDGRLTDNKGRTVDFKNTIIIMTSNMGSHLIMEALEGVQNPDEKLLEKTKGQVFELLKQQIRPEFLNRIDEIIMFTPLTRENVKDIVRLQIRRLAGMLAKRDIRLEAEDSALEVMADQGYDPQFGARPIKRVIQRDLMNELSRQILEGKVEPKDVIVIKGQNNALVFENKRA